MSMFYRIVNYEELLRQHAQKLSENCNLPSKFHFLGSPPKYVCMCY